jgi:hypothetical protein
MAMGRFLQRTIPAILVVLLLPVFTAAQKSQESKKKEKPIRREVLNFDGGILFETDGGVSEFTCFRLAGRVTAPPFFDNFKRIDDERGTEYRRGEELLTEFPEELHVSFVVFDIPCASQLQHTGPRKYLSPEMMKTLRFSFYWKRGIELRHIENLKHGAATAEPVEPYNTESTEELPKRFRWYLQYTRGCASRCTAVMRRENGKWKLNSRSVVLADLDFPISNFNFPASEFVIPWN